MIKTCETIAGKVSECNEATNQTSGFRTGNSDKILCCYINPTKQLQIVRIKNKSPNRNFERVIFPGQRLLFEGVREAQVEIHTSMADGTVMGQTIKCDRLRVFEHLESA